MKEGNNMEQKYIYDKKYNRKRKAIELICENCGTKFLKLLNQYKNTKHHFCCVNCSKQYRSNRVLVKCAFCGKEFEKVPSSFKHSKSKLYFCSVECKNEAQKIKNNFTNIQPNHYGKGSNYQRICFDNHPHKCCICGEEHIVAVHHYDGNHNNNDPSNLIPLCPTHHCYWHSKFRKLIKDKVDEYINNFITSLAQK